VEEEEEAAAALGRRLQLLQQQQHPTLHTRVPFWQRCCFLFLIDSCG